MSKKVSPEDFLALAARPSDTYGEVFLLDGGPASVTHVALAPLQPWLPPCGPLPPPHFTDIGGRCRPMWEHCRVGRLLSLRDRGDIQRAVALE